MASLPRKSTCLELYRSDITRPEPVKITKTSQTVGNCSASEKTACERYGLPKSSTQRKWSSSIIFDWPVTVQKRRSKIKNGRSISYESKAKDSMSPDGVQRAQRAKLCSRGVRYYDTSMRLSVEDLNSTPRAKKLVPRVDLSGSALKSNSFHQKFQIETTRLPFKDDKEIPHQKGFFNHHRSFDSRGLNCSDSKGFDSVSKENVFPTLEISEQCAYQRTSSINSNLHIARKSLLTKHQLNKKSILNPSKSSYSSGSNSIKTQDSYSNNDSKLAVSYHSRPTISSIKRLFTRSLSSTLTTTITQPTNDFILFPEIIITPEVPIIGFTKNIFWVAVEIIGALRQVEREETNLNEFHQQQASSCRKIDEKNYGYLDSVHIYLKAGHDCVIKEIIGNNFGPITIGVNESHLVLVKIKIGAVATSIYPQASLDNLEEFKNNHGKLKSEYITVRINYIHSGYREVKSSTIYAPGYCPQKIQIQVENAASIRRYGPKLACLLYRNHPNVDIFQSKNPVLDIINIRLPSLEAKEAFRLIAISRENVMPLKCSILADKSNDLTGSIASMESDFNLDDFPLPPSDNLDLHISPQPSCYFDPYNEIYALLNYCSPLFETRNLSRINYSQKFDEDEVRLISEFTSVCSFDDGLQELISPKTNDETIEMSTKSKDSVAAIPLTRASSLGNDSSLQESSTFGSQLGLGIESNWLLGLLSGS